jgi:SAM-dependent methyltransferase
MEFSVHCSPSIIAHLGSWLHLVYQYEKDDLIPESSLPVDWCRINSAAFEYEAPYYSRVDNDGVALLNQRLNSYLAEHILHVGDRDVLDVGIGDGFKVLDLCQKAQAKQQIHLTPHGTEISEKMRQLAQRRGVVDVVLHDMKAPLPFADQSFDVILYYSCDFGYLADPAAARADALRLAALDDAFAKLRPGGRLVLELLNYDNCPQAGREICEYTRYPAFVVRCGWIELRLKLGEGQRHFIRHFSLEEIENLAERSSFGKQKFKSFYIVRRSNNRQQLGAVLHGKTTLSLAEGYRLVVVLERGGGG